MVLRRHDDPDLKYMKKTPYRLILVLLLSSASSPGMIFFRPQPIAVAVKAVIRGIVEASVSNTRAGTVKACRRARLAPAIGGQIAKLAVKEGDRVSTGQYCYRCGTMTSPRSCNSRNGKP